MSDRDDAARKGLQELDALFEELDALLKNPDVADALSTRGVNLALALTAVFGLKAYLNGDKTTAIEDFSTVAEEIATRSPNKA